MLALCRFIESFPHSVTSPSHLLFLCHQTTDQSAVSARQYAIPNLVKTVWSFFLRPLGYLVAHWCFANPHRQELKFGVVLYTSLTDMLLTSCPCSRNVSSTRSMILTLPMWDVSEH